MPTSPSPDDSSASAPELFEFRHRELLLGIFTALVVIGTLVFLLLPSSYPGKGHNYRGNCRNNLKYIALALQNYHDVYGSFPPAYVADKSGRPMHSWRVLLLPFVEQQALYDQYRFDEPWDGPNNRQLAGAIGRVYSCPADHQKRNAPDSVETSYVAIVGPHTAWPGEQATTIGSFADGTENVLLVVEVRDTGIHWMEPRDLHVTQMTRTINAPSGQGISSHHRECANVAFADGRTDRLPNSLPADVLQSWINTDDGTLRDPAAR